MVQIENGRIIDEDGISTTFPMDFTIAEKYGVAAIKDTYNRAFNDWKRDYRFLTHLVIALNHKVWEWYDKRNYRLSELYQSLWEEADSYACEHLRGDDADYFYRTTD